MSYSPNRGAWWLGSFAVVILCLGSPSGEAHAQHVGAGRQAAAPYSDPRAAGLVEVSPLSGLGLRQVPPTFRDFAESEAQEIDIDSLVLIALDNNKYLQVVGFRPALWKTRIDEAAAVFDPTIEIGGIYEENNSQLASRLTAAGTTATSQLRQSFEPPPVQNDNISWSKRLNHGATVQLNYSGNYERLNPKGDFRIVNPAWRSGISAAIEQPLLRGAGQSANYAKINIAKQFYHRANDDVQQAANYLARTVRRAYWDLDLISRVLRIQAEATQRAKKTYNDEEKRFGIGATTRAHVAQALELYHQYRILELDAKQASIEQERRCRQLIGLPGFDQHRFSVTENATIAEPVLDWHASVAAAIATRPELAAQRHHINAYRYEVQLRSNETLPDWSALGRVSLGGLDDDWASSVGEVLDGDNAGWMVGTVYRRPVNNSRANAILQRARLHVAQQQAVLEQLEHTAIHKLQQAYQVVMSTRERLVLQGERVAAANQRLDASEKQYTNRQIGEVDYLLRAQQTQTEALLGHARAIADYRKAVEEWNYQRGTILTDEGSPPDGL